MTVDGRVFEAGRLRAVRATGLLDTPAEPAFDRLATVASTVLEAPFAFVTLVDDRRSFWKAAIGIPSADPADRQNHVEESFCQYVVASGEPLIVGDTAADPRTCDNPSIEAMNVAAWAGFPIHAPGGEVLGSFCVVDTKPREWNDRDVDVLGTLAASASSEISLRAGAAAAATLARTLQESLLPPTLPRIPGLEVAARYRAAGEGVDVVGDFYDVFQSGAATWSFVIGDVSGKGVEAAKVTALAHYTLRAAAMSSDDPRVALRTLNDALLRQRPDDDLFLTAAYLRLALGGAVRGTLALGGHELALIRRAETGAVEPVGVAGTVLGCVGAPELTDVPVALEPGDLLVLYTDGVLDARQDGERFGAERLTALVGAAETGAAEPLAARIDSAVAAWSAGPLADDAAVLVVAVPR